MALAAVTGNVVQIAQPVVPQAHAPVAPVFQLPTLPERHTESLIPEKCPNFVKFGFYADMRKILEVLAELSGRNLNITDTAEALRAHLVPLLLQRLVSHKDPIPVVTLEPSFENVLINTDRQNQQEDLIIDANLSKTLLTKLAEISEEQMAVGKSVFLIVSPIIRRKLAKLIRAHLADLNVLSFTELPETKKVDVIGTIAGNPEDE